MSQSGPYRLMITATARRQLSEQIPENIAFAAYEFINGPLVDNPHRVGKRMAPPFQDRYSARRGTYRLLFRIDEATHTVAVLAVGPRSDIYRPH